MRRRLGEHAIDVTPVQRTFAFRRRLAIFCPGLLGAMLVAMAAIAPPHISAENSGERSLEAWPALALSLVQGGLAQPVHVTHAGDGSGRLFVVERAGRIRVIGGGALLAIPFLSITNRVGSTWPEQGLLSVAFPPGYATSRHFYVYYTDKAGNIVIARYDLTADPNIANSNDETIVVSIPHPSQVNHNGGQLAFGPIDGLLYIGTGDGGGGDDPANNAQNTNSLLGKLLRIDVESGSPLTYTIPISNPFYQMPGYRGEVWAYGLRNPWRFSFDRQTGDLFIGDVGQASREEIDFQPASSIGGVNYGWPCYEGNLTRDPGRCSPVASFTFPIWDYSIADPARECAVTGGFVYRGPRSILLRGVYVYGDHCSGRIWGLRPGGGGWQNQILHGAPFNISTFGEDQGGNLYLADYGGGRIFLVEGLDVPLFLPLVVK